MIKIFATEKVKDIDKYTILNMPIAPIDLVEEAVTAFVNEFRNHYSKMHRIVVLPVREIMGLMPWALPVSCSMNRIKSLYICSIRQDI